ncbi:hypothetical protein TD95_004048 [Thielaviopsis punctulata]|uniref:Cwf18 pre-mRNA splicing factor n=1 Tax=Thielaviopsis punctulata TaxID=72032 RepID=A0A0F4ZGJ0_9PEZI|nr:hypothetical protein TD95_004048 [Thielaviopsis punctulata]
MSSLGAASDARKARLAQLRSLKRKQPSDESATPESDRPSAPVPPAEASAEASTEAPIETPAKSPAASPPAADVAAIHLSGRNYDAAQRAPKLGFDSAPDAHAPTLEAHAVSIARTVSAQAAADAADAAGIDLFKLQPKKPNWDLKRDLDKRLETLNVRTDNAIARLVRERIAAAQKKSVGKEEDAGLDGAELVEGLRVREQEMQEEERRERAELDA